MTSRRELALFAAVLLALVAGFFSESLFGGKVLSPADVLFASASFREVKGPDYEPANRLLMDPVLQFQPWIEWNRACLRAGELPLWNERAGCGAPHLANGQAAVFDPFLLFAYLGSVPKAYGPMAAARLWFAGVGMFLLARAWGLGPWGRWFAGLAYPFCGFLVGWLLFPVTPVAIWLPWGWLATDALWRRPGGRAAGGLAVAVAGTVLGGHVQTAAHVLLALLADAGWRLGTTRAGRWAAARWWAAGVLLGLTVAAVEIVPLAAYLTRSPVWGDRARDRVPAWRLSRPRPLDAVRTALPYAYGSHRRGQPNLAKVAGVHNLNETAGGFVGLATLVWLAPLAWSARRSNPRVRFLVGLTVVGGLAAFQFPPVDNILRTIPVLNVTDNRRLTLWVAAGLCLLGGIGLDHLDHVRRSRAWTWWAGVWVVAALGLVAVAVGVRGFAPTIQARAEAHYLKAATEEPDRDPESFRAMARRRADETVRFIPRYFGLAAAEGLALAALVVLLRRRAVPDGAGRAVLIGLTAVELAGFGWGLNPAIDPADDRPVPPVIAALREKVGDDGRIIGVGAELPPNVLMRYGLADARNYDSVELTRSLDWLDPLYPAGSGERTSRRTVTWDRVVRARDRLREAGVRAVVGATPPPPELGGHAERVGSVWLVGLEARPIVELVGNGGRWDLRRTGNGRVEGSVESFDAGPARLVVRQTSVPGWRAEVDGRPAPVLIHRGTFLAVEVPPGLHDVKICYDPIEVRIAMFLSISGLSLVVFALTGLGPFRSSGIVVVRLGRTQAIGLESDSLPSSRTT